ncbi:hypothetical protein L1987_27103 [Smallanthus sonchifolius]|uniref:Uncharacterized protein n=1 Tax=Smallanthus sonchifolius TaxID=185202 RepID=A0ACB9IAR8_9ASTR|nr:hypothetical protein L1987_27103 [Smallanthus sonchifolius]
MLVIFDGHIWVGYVKVNLPKASHVPFVYPLYIYLLANAKNHEGGMIRFLHIFLSLNETIPDLVKITSFDSETRL